LNGNPPVGWVLGVHGEWGGDPDPQDEEEAVLVLTAMRDVISTSEGVIPYGILNAPLTLQCQIQLRGDMTEVLLFSSDRFKLRPPPIENLHISSSILLCTLLHLGMWYMGMCTNLIPIGCIFP